MGVISCFNPDDNPIVKDEQNQRIISLERKLDSMLNEQHIQPILSNTTSRDSLVTTKVHSQATQQCSALTKKSRQCKRQARSGGYCWQHGG